MRLSRLLLFSASTLLVVLLSQLLLEALDGVNSGENVWQLPLAREEINYEQLFKEVTQPVVVWWAPVGGGVYYSGRVRQCGRQSCYFTEDRHFRHHPLLKAMMFYGTSVNWTDLPLPRNHSLLWALLHEESPRNNLPLTHLAALSLFNLTATCSRHSDYPLTTQYLSSLHALTDKKYFVPVEVKDRLQEEEGLAPVMFLQSDCSTTLDRDSYVAELMKYINVDSYGACLHNKDLPQHLQPPHSLDTMMSEDLLGLVAKYKFTLAVENAVCDDYITEKLWRPLVAGSLPVYIGSPTATDWFPNNQSAVLGVDFPSPRDLAEHLIQLNSNGDEYNKYLRHKLKAVVSNQLLIRTMEEREWEVESSSEKESFIERFSCFVCERAVDAGAASIATQDHYSCPMPMSILSRAPNTSNFWLNSWFYAKCEAEVVRDLVSSGVNYISDYEFKKVLTDLVMKSKCQYLGGNHGGFY